MSPEKSPVNYATLAFKDGIAEQAYLVHWAEETLHHDKFGLYCPPASVMQLIGTFYCIVQRMNAGWLLIFLSLVLHTMHGYLLLCHPSWYCHNRVPVGGTVLALFRLVLVVLVPTTSADKSPATRVLYKTGIIPLAWYSLALPLPFRYQLLAQVCTILAFQWSLALPACMDLSSEPSLMAPLEAVWGGGRRLLSYYLLLQGVSPGAQLDGPQEAQLVCWSSLALMLLLVGLVLPLPVWYLLELHSRGAFYKQYSEQAGNGGYHQQEFQINRGPFESCEDAFHMPVSALIMVALALSSSGLMLLVLHGPYLLQLHQRVLGGV